MRSPKVTVYIPSRNYGRFLESAVESVLRQTMPDWELFIINDGSTDETRDVMNLYASDPRIRLFEAGGVGLPAVCNLALAEARGDYVIRLDGDDVFDENILLVLSRRLDDEPETALVFPDYFLMDEDGEILSLERREKVGENEHLGDNPANGACSLIRRDVLNAVGGYREDLGAQDGFDLWTKLRGRYKVANVNLPLFFYRRHGENLTNRHRHILAARRRIKIDGATAMLDRRRPITAVIPCRRMYDFCPDVWKREVGGKTLLARAIERCAASDAFDHIVVASDNREVEEALAAFNDPRLSFFERDPGNTIRSKSLVPTLERIAQPLDPERRGLTVLVYVQSPFVDAQTLEEALYTLALNDADCAMGVEEIREPIYRRSPFGLRPINPAKGVSSDFDALYRESNTAIAVKNANFASGSLTGPSVANFIVEPDRCFFINSEQSLKIANILDEES